MKRSTFVATGNMAERAARVLLAIGVTAEEIDPSPVIADPYAEITQQD